MIALTAIKKTRYAGQAYSPGDSFEARDESDAYVLTSLLKVARRDPVSVPEAKGEPDPPVPEEAIASADADNYEPVVVPDETPVEAEPEPEPEAATPKKRTYRRRDLSAES